MGLDATVYCDCYEKGRLRQAPPQPELLYVDQRGEVMLNWEAPGADIFADDKWREHACEHVRGELVWYRIGNIALVGFLREAVEATPDLFPTLLSKVIYDGGHGGDFLTLEQVEALKPEVELLSGLHRSDSGEESLLRTFEGKMRELVEASLSGCKPIVF